MNNPKQAQTKKRITKGLAVLLAIALLIGGTLAWNDFSQHATNPFRGGQGIGNYNVTLNDRFDPVHNWTKGQTVNKTVSVINLAESNDEVFVRLSLKEFMQTRAQSEEFITDANGNEILFATFAEGDRLGQFMTMEDAQNVMGDNGYLGYNVQTGTDQDGNPIYTEYATTQDTEIRNGIYGKPMLIPGEIDNTWGTPLSGDVAHKVQANAECDYEPYKWDTKGALGDNEDKTGIRDYITFESAPIMTLEEWEKDVDDENNQQWGQFWIVDPADGWAYWGEPLAPGKTTGDFISNVTLETSPLAEGVNGSFDYFMHIDMQVIAGAWAEFQNELPNWRNTANDVLMDKMAEFVQVREKLDPQPEADEADFALLNEAVEAAEAIYAEGDPEHYNTAAVAWAPFVSALNTASALNNDPPAGTTKEKVNEVKGALTSAQGNLVDLEALDTAIDDGDQALANNAEKEDLEEYDTLSDLIEDGNTLRADVNATKQQVSEKAEEINTAITNLNDAELDETEE